MAVAYPENEPSRRVLTKVGFRQTGMSDRYYGVRAMTYELGRSDIPKGSDPR